MKRRLTLAILGTAAAALVLAGLGTLALARIGAAQRTEEEVRAQASATAQLVRTASSGVAGLGDQAIAALVDQVCNDSGRPREVLCRAVQREARQRAELTDTLEAESIGLLAVDADGDVTGGTLPAGVSLDELGLDRLRSGETTSGRSGRTAWAAAPITTGELSGTGQLTAVVLTRPISSVPGAIPWFLLAAGITLLIGAVVADRLSRRLTAPLAQATAATGRIAAGDLSVRLEEHPGASRPDELDKLGRSINAMAASLERLQGLERQFLLSISHDLRTPLTSVRGYAEAIADGTAPDPAAAAAVILSESRRLERLVADLLDLAKLEARAFGFTPVTLDLAELARDVADGFGRACHEAGLAIVVQAPPEPVWVVADPDRLGQVVANLVENARTFATATIAVRVEVRGDVPVVLVADDGPGIAAEDLPHVFERLYVASHTPRREETGSGLGLAIVRELVEAMGGRVEASSGGAGGTTFVVSLPAAPPPTAAT